MEVSGFETERKINLLFHILFLIKFFFNEMKLSRVKNILSCVFYVK